jgi:hypothetical protein
MIRSQTDSPDCPCDEKDEEDEDEDDEEEEEDEEEGEGGKDGVGDEVVEAIDSGRLALPVVPTGAVSVAPTGALSATSSPPVTQGMVGQAGVTGVYRRNTSFGRCVPGGARHPLSGRTVCQSPSKLPHARTR